jgi:hypothetical protein
VLLALLFVDPILVREIYEVIKEFGSMETCMLQSGEQCKYRSGHKTLYDDNTFLVND